MDCIVDRRDQTDHVYCLTGVIRSFFPSRASFCKVPSVPLLYSTRCCFHLHLGHFLWVDSHDFLWLLSY